MAGLIKDLKKFNRISRIANSTLGSGGPGSVGYAGTASQHIRFEVINEKTIKAHYQGSIAVSSKSMLSTLMSKLVSDAVGSIKRGLENFAKEYKEQFNQSITLTMNENTIVDSIEFTSYSVFKPAQSGMLRVTVLIDVSGGDDVENYFEKVEKENEELAKKFVDKRKEAMKSNKSAANKSKK